MLVLSPYAGLCAEGWCAWQARSGEQFSVNLGRIQYRTMGVTGFEQWFACEPMRPAAVAFQHKAATAR